MFSLVERELTTLTALHRVCSSREARKHWVPATLHLNSSLLPPISTDYIALFDLNTRSYRRLELHGLPAESNGVWVHGIALWRDVVDPSKLTLFVNSHRPPKDRSLGHVQGADSVIEIFETTVGSHEARHVKTVKHDLIRTPNNMVATGPRTFYASNDHRYKVRWDPIFASLVPAVHGCLLRRFCLVTRPRLTFPSCPGTLVPPVREVRIGRIRHRVLRCFEDSSKLPRCGGQGRVSEW